MNSSFVKTDEDNRKGGYFLLCLKLIKNEKRRDFKWLNLTWVNL